MSSKDFLLPYTVRSPACTRTSPQGMLGVEPCVSETQMKRVHPLPGCAGGFRASYFTCTRETSVMSLCVSSGSVAVKFWRWMGREAVVVRTDMSKKGAKAIHTIAGTDLLDLGAGFLWISCFSDSPNGCTTQRASREGH